MKASKLLCISLLLSQSEAVSIRQKVLSASHSKSRSHENGQASTKQLEELDSLVRVTKEDEQVLEAKKSFEMANDSELMNNDKVKEIKKEPVEKPKSLEQINEADAKELSGEEKAMKNEIREIQQNEQEDKAEENAKTDQDEDLLAPVVISKGDGDQTTQSVQQVKSKQNVPDQFPRDTPKGKGILGKKKKEEHRAQLPTREESIADEMEKEETFEGQVESKIRPQASKDNSQLVWQKKAKTEIDEASAVNAFAQEQNQKFDTQQAKYDKIQEAENKIKANQQKKDSQAKKENVVQTPVQAPPQTQVQKSKFAEQMETVAESPVAKEADPAPKSAETQPEKKPEPQSEVDKILGNDPENEKELQKLGNSIKTDEEIQQINIKKLEEENHSKIQGLNVQEEIGKLKAGTYDNILMTSQQLQNGTEQNSNSEMSPSMQTIENELKSLAQKDPAPVQAPAKEPHVKPTPENTQKSGDQLTYYSSNNHNHSDPAPNDEQKMAVDVKDLASGIVESLSKDLKKDTKQEVKEEKKTEEKKTEEKKTEAKPEKKVEATPEKKVEVIQVQKEKKVEVKAEPKQTKIALSEKKDDKNAKTAQKTETKTVEKQTEKKPQDAGKDSAKKLVDDKAKEVVIKLDTVEQADQAASGFIKKYAEAQVEKQQEILLEQNKVLDDMQNSFIRKQLEKVRDKPQGLFARMQQKVNEEAEATNDAKEFAENMALQTKAILNAQNYVDVIKASK